MKKARFRNYLDKQATGKNDPIKKGADVKESNDEHIAQDFEGFPGGHAKEEVINPKSAKEKKTAATGVKDGEKKLKAKAAQENVGEEDSEGSGGAFDATEEVKE